MTTSGSTDFSLVTNSLIEEAFDLCAIGSEGEAISADMYRRAKSSANLLVKAWSASEHLWLKTERSVTLIASTGSYALTPRPSRILDVRRRLTTGSIDSPLREMSREEYLALPTKSSDSIPTGYYFNPQIAAGTLYVWPRPDTATTAANTLQITYLRKIEDFDASNNDPDLPQEWLLAFTYALAEQLALKYGIPADRRAEITARAKFYKDQIESWDTETASLYLQPDWQW